MPTWALQGPHLPEKRRVLGWDRPPVRTRRRRLREEHGQQLFAEQITKGVVWGLTWPRNDGLGGLVSTGICGCHRDPSEGWGPLALPALRLDGLKNQVNLNRTREVGGHVQKHGRSRTLAGGTGAPTVTPGPQATSESPGVKEAAPWTRQDTWTQTRARVWLPCKPGKEATPAPVAVVVMG